MSSLLNTKKYRIYITAGLMFLLFVLTGVYAQPGKYFIQHFNSENGLPQSSIKGLEIDSKGYVWLATETGLVRYDGSNFKLYNRTSGKQFINKRIGSLHLNKYNEVFFEVEGNRYYKISKQNLPEEFVPGTEEREAAQKKSSDIQYRVYNRCLAKAERNEIPKWGLPDIKMINTALMSNLALLNKRYYYFNEQKELISIDTSIGNFKKIELEGFEKNDKAANVLQQPVAILQRGEELFLRWGEYIYITRFSDDSSRLFGDTLLRIGAISNVTTFANYKQLKLFFLGTQTDGLYIYRAPDFSTVTYTNQELNVFYAQAAIGKNKVLTEKGLLPESSRPLFTHYLSKSILKTSGGHYLLNKWISWEISGLSELDSNMKEINFIPEFNLRINSMLQMNDGQIWIAAETKFLGKLAGKHITWLRAPAILDSFGIKTMEECSPAELWIAGNNGLAKVNIQTGECVIYPEFSNLNIRTLRQDARGVLWIGTYGNGYYAYYKGKAVQMPRDRENYLLNAHAFLEDQKGYCWITTNRGLFQAKMSDLYNYLDGKIAAVYYHYYDKSRGFLTNEFNGGCSPSAIKLNNGFFSFPSMNGVVQFDPEHIRPEYSNSSIYIDAIRADTLQLDPNLDHFVFPGKMNELQIAVSSPFFGTPYNHYIEYQLKGLDPGWQQLPSNGVLLFNHLSKGDYELVLRKQYGFENRQVEKHLFFRVQPVFYETGVFKLLVALLLLGLMFLVFWFRVRILVRQRQRLENEVKERTGEQHLLIESLEATVSELEQSREQLFQNSVFMEKLAMIITHDLQSPLRFLSDASGRINQKVNDNDLSSIAELSKEIRKSSGTIHRFVEDFGVWIRTLGKNFRVEAKPFMLADLLEQQQQFFSEQLKIKGNAMHIETGKQWVVKTDRQLLQIILRNLIDNANKNTRQGSIDITVSVTNRLLTISIKDTGTGIRTNVLERLQKSINQPISVQSIKEGVGYGYQFIIDFCKLLGITLEIKSVVGEGTEIQLINLPTE